MPTKKKLVQKQKQKQRQSVVVNVNVAKARAKASAKKSGRGGRGSVMMLPPPIYASPIDRLTPAMYSSQGQQIQQQSLDQMLKTFLSNQQNQQVGSFKTLGSAPNSSYYPGSSSVSYNPSLKPELPSKSEWLPADVSPSIGFRSLDLESYNPMSDDVSEMTDPSYMSETPSPFNNEERSYLSVAEPDYESTAPKFSQNEARVSQGNIYESLKQLESNVVRDENLARQLREETYSPNKSSPSKTNIIPFDDVSSLSNVSSLKSNQSLASYAGMYGPRVPINRAEQENYFKQIADDSSSGSMSYYD